MSSELSVPKFYHFSQNNSGGSFVLDEFAGITNHVIIQALNAEDANRRAESIGLYFNGVEDRQDCDCCGDRWYSQWDSNSGTNLPEVYGEPADCYIGTAWMKPGKEIVVHYLDGSVKWHGVFRKS